MTPLTSIAVVGASLAGLQAAQALRRAGFDGTLTMVGAEPDLPYDRPPLSKGFLDGSVPEDKLRLRGAADPDALGVAWRLGTRAVGLDVATRTLRLHGPDGDSELGADGIVIATGSSPRTLPGFDHPGVHVLRTVAEARALRAALEAGPTRVLVIGAGFIGAEVAATARGLGLEVTLVEAAPTPLARVLDAASGAAIAELHRGHGVDVRLGTGVDGLELGPDGAVVGARLAGGDTIDTDLVVVGVGAAPNTAWLEGSGLTVDNGVVCDDTCLAAPGIVAAGDVARWPNRRFGGTLTRVEQWDNAVEQGTYAAKRLLAWAAGEPVEPYTPVPWFWSDQYDRKIQLAGIPSNHATVVNGSIADQMFLQVYADDDGRFVGALGWNRPRQAIQARMLLNDGASLAEASEKLAG